MRLLANIYPSGQPNISVSSAKILRGGCKYHLHVFFTFIKIMHFPNVNCKACESLHLYACQADMCFRNQPHDLAYHAKCLGNDVAEQPNCKAMASGNRAHDCQPQPISRRGAVMTEGMGAQTSKARIPTAGGDGEALAAAG